MVSCEKRSGEGGTLHCRTKRRQGAHNPGVVAAVCNHAGGGGVQVGRAGHTWPTSSAMTAISMPSWGATAGAAMLLVAAVCVSGVCLRRRRWRCC